MSKTGQGLLLEEIYDGQMKTQREHLLKRIPWWEMMQEMMRDRSSSDPDIVVTGATDINTQYNGDGDDVSDNDGQDDRGNDGDDGNNGGESPYTRTHGTKRFNYDVDDDDDDMDDDELLDSVSVRASEPRASSEASLSFRTPTASQRSVNGLRIPGRDAALPGLDRLASQVSADSMRAHAVSAHSETPSRGLKRTSIGNISMKSESHKENDASSIASSSRDKKKETGKGRASSIIDDALIGFQQRASEDRAAIIAEREQTKRRKLELRSQELAVKTQQRDREHEVHEAHFTMLESKVEALHALLTATNAKLDTILMKLGGYYAS
ncbi:unnamed protein product [Tilletia caries]|nr:unnamed protein product [Tilletia caries]